MKSCPCCARPFAIAESANARPWITDWFYMVLAECLCGSTMAVVIWELEEP